MALAVKISVPWEAANTPHDFSGPARHRGRRRPGADRPRGRANAGRRSTSRAGSRRAGRPECRRGSTSTRPTAVNIAGLSLPHGRYEWTVAIDDELVDRVAFTVMT